MRSVVSTLCDPRHLCPWEFSRKEYWSGLQCPLPRGSSLAKDRIQICNPALQLDFLLFEPPGKPKNTGMGSLSLLQGIFLTQESNQGLPHCRQILYQLSHQESPRILEWVAYPLSSGSSQPRDRTQVSCIAGRFFTF